MTARIKLLNGEFDPLTLDGTVSEIFRMIEQRRSGWIATVNVAILMMMRDSEFLQSFADRAALVVADGQPLVWLSKLWGRPLPERVAGVEMVDAVCARAAQSGHGVYLLGATDAVIQEVTSRLRRRYPRLRIACSDGYFNTDQAAQRVADIRAKQTDILFVGMGVPRQETFIESNLAALGVGAAIGVGGSFDVLSSLRKRAPAWVQGIGMEWMFRLLQEPRRLFARYMVTNARFVGLVIRHLFAGRSAGR